MKYRKEPFRVEATQWFGNDDGPEDFSYRVDRETPLKWTQAGSSEVKQQRYQDQQGDDWIDEAARTLPVEQFRGAMIFTVGKYLRRIGKKDDLVKEIDKMIDYLGRWRDYETKDEQ